MSSFFNKLNTLIKAQINDLVDFDKDNRTSRSRRKFLARQDISRGLMNDVAGLRKRIDEALAHEENLQKRIDALYRSVTEWDEKADAAVAEGREADARFAVNRMQQAQRELNMMEADLREHHVLVQELISQVNTLEGVVEQAIREEAAEKAKHEPASEADEAEAEAEGVLHKLNERLTSTRQQLSDLIASSRQAATPTVETPEAAAPAPAAPRKAPTKAPRQTPVETEPKVASEAPSQNKEVDDDLARRLARLSKPEDPGTKVPPRKD